jgi:hypothetical protein
LSFSNHGGRQVDTAPPAIECLKDIINVVDGRVEGSFYFLTIFSMFLTRKRFMRKYFQSDGENSFNTVRKDENSFNTKTSFPKSCVTSNESIYRFLSHKILQKTIHRASRIWKLSCLKISATGNVIILTKANALLKINCCFFFSIC